MSGRIEETSRPTALAFANRRSASIRISSVEKRIVLQTLRQRRPKWGRTLLHVHVFATLVYLLLQDHIEELDRFVIDSEYTGYEALIKDRVMTLCGRRGIAVPRDQIVFDRVGKKSPAHKLAYQVYKGFTRPGRMVSAGEVLAEFGESKDRGLRAK